MNNRTQIIPEQKKAEVINYFNTNDDKGMLTISLKFGISKYKASRIIDEYFDSLKP